MNIGLIAQGAGMFGVTNIDDLVILALFFGQASSSRDATLRVIMGQYLGFAAILAISFVGALGAGLFLERVIPYLGLLPLGTGLLAAWKAWGHRHDSDGDRTATEVGPTALSVAAVTFANGGDNIGLYIPVFATTGPGGLATYAVVFLVLVAVWCLIGHHVATRSLVATTLARWGHILVPIVSIGIGGLILIEGGAFGL